MDDIYILHIGGFEIDAGNLVTRQNQIDAIVASLVQRRVDYIVVCGNLTKRGDFAGMADCLDRLGRLLSGSRKRLIIAPGRQDDPDNAASGAFKNFHESFYDGEMIDGQKIVVPTGATIDARRFRDITLIAGAHTGLTPTVEELSKLCKTIKVQTELWHKAFTWDGLRILAIDSAPQLYGLPEPTALRHEIDLILCGPGKVPIVPIQPFAEMPPIVGLPPQSTNGDGEKPQIPRLFWNMVSVRVPPRPREAEANRAQFIVKSYDERLKYDRPALRYAAENHRLLDPRGESVFLFKTSLLRKLEEALKSSDLIEVTMYGDVWKTIIMEALHSGMKIGDTRRTFKSFFLKEYPPGDKPTEWTRQGLPILKDIQSWKKGLSAGNAAPLALVVDTAFSAHEATNRNRVDEVKKMMMGRFGGVHNRLQILYLVSSYDTARRVDKDAPRIHLDPIDDFTLGQFIAIASRALPIQPVVFKGLTGGYVGFIKLLTDELQNDYLSTGRHDFSNRWEFEAAVIRVCAHSEALRLETALFFRTLINRSDDRRRVAERLIQKMCELKVRGDGSILTEEVCIQVKQEDEPQLLWELEELTHSHIVSRKNDRFVLMERIPFLVHLARPVGVQMVFLSFDERDRKLVDELKAALVAAGIDSWEWRDARDVRKTLEGEIKDRLNRCDIVVVLWTENSVKSKLVLNEARVAAKPDSPRLLNWFEGAVPSMHKEKLDMLKEEGAKLPTSDERGRKISEILTEFSGSGLGADTLEEVMVKLKATLHPLPRCTRGQGGGA